MNNAHVKKIAIAEEEPHGNPDSVEIIGMRRKHKDSQAGRQRETGNRRGPAAVNQFLDARIHNQ